MLSAFRRDRRFWIVAGLSLVIGLGLYLGMVSPSVERATAAAGQARGAQVQVVSQAERIFQALGQQPGLNAAIRENQRFFAEAESRKETLLDTLAYRPPARFRLPDDLQPDQPSGYLRWFDRELRQLQDFYHNSPAYTFVREPRLNSPTLLADLEVDRYLPEALAWAGVAPPREESRRGAGLFAGGVRNDSGGGLPLASVGAEPVDEASEEASALRRARAETRLQLVLLSIVAKLIDAGRGEDGLTLHDVRFADRGRDVARRFRVEESAPSFFRPIRVRVDVQAPEPVLMAYVRRAVAPGEERQYLALDALTLVVPDALEAEPESERVRARVEFLAFLVDPDQPFAADGTCDRAGSGLGAWRFR